MTQSPGTVVCQSCAMPLIKPEDHGTNADGAPNHEYCTYCYQNGKFNSPDETFDQMAEFLAGFLVKEQGVDPAKAETVARESITGLKRWQ